MQPNPYEPPREPSSNLDPPEPKLPNRMSAIPIGLLVLTALLVAAMVGNHLVHGFGCWGLQPGGPESAMIYDLQIFACFIGMVWLALALALRKVWVRVVQLLVIAGLVCVSYVLFHLFGWQAHTSMHNMGAEQIPPFAAVVITTYLIARYGR